MRIHAHPALPAFVAAASLLAVVFAGERGAPPGGQTKAGNQTPQSRKIPCKIPENASSCYWSHGRLSIYEGGGPAYRIWKIGTHRMLGVFSGPSRYPPVNDDDIFNPELPRELDRAYEADNQRHRKETGIMWTVPPAVFADFEVCPLRPEREAQMQPVCVEGAKNIFVKDDDY